MGLIKEDLAKQLAIFGLTLNQSKIYLTIVEAGSLSVAEIATQTNMHRQDVYQILPKLEENGLITKTLGTPITITAIPVEKALKELISIKWQQAREEILCMQANLKNITESLTLLGNQDETEEPFFVLLGKENEVTNTADILFENVEQECDFAASVELLELKAEKWFRRFTDAVDRGAKIRLIVNASNKLDRAKEVVHRITPRKGDFEVKFLCHKSVKPFQVFDQKVVWIFTSKKQSSGWPCVLWSNGKHLVEPYQERFEKVLERKVGARISLIFLLTI